MKEIHKYIADDGKEFDNRYDCEEYEQAMRFIHLGNDLQFYDCNKESITRYDNAMYIIARTEAAKDTIDDLAEELNERTPWKENPSLRRYIAWYWDEEIEEWRSYIQLKERQEELTAILAAFDTWFSK